MFLHGKSVRFQVRGSAVGELLQMQFVDDPGAQVFYHALLQGSVSLFQQEKFQRFLQFGKLREILHERSYCMLP